jgi:diguanylate cyclase (GGDEF)-like protein
MRHLAIAAALLICLSMPLTFFILSWSSDKELAKVDAEKMVEVLIPVIQENPDFWSYNVQKFTQVLHTHELRNIGSIKIFNSREDLLYEELNFTPVWMVSSRIPIILDSKIYGYVEIIIDSSRTLYSSLLAFTLFIAVGALTGLALYRFPANIVRQSQERIGKAFEKLRHLSYYDSLTELPNRTCFREDLESILQQNPEDKSLVLFFLDLDRFKIVNDTLGHNRGDLLLQAVSQRLTECVDHRSTVFRFGGDEFTILLRDMKDKAEVQQIASRIVEHFKRPFTIVGYDLFITVSLGISVYPRDGRNPESLIRCADMAMYHVKQAGKNQYAFYNTEMTRVAKEQLQLEVKLRKAFEQRELFLNYQPRVNLNTGKVSGMEALMRWQDPDLGRVSPEEFIPLAEETGLIVPMGKWALRTACRQTREWQNMGLRDLTLSVNISTLQFQQMDIVEMILGVLQETDLDPHFLELEITESLFMVEREEALRKLNLLVEKGIKISIDDFGTGYSSLNYLRYLPVNVIKIDKEFLRNIGKVAYDEALAEAIIAMAHSLNLRVVAEGIETETQYRFIQAKGCDEMQGYFFSKPVDAVTFETLAFHDQGDQAKAALI